MSDDAVRQARDWLSRQTGHDPDIDACHAQPTALDASDSPDADPAAVARTVLLRRLAAQDRTRHELAVTLAGRNVPADVAEEVLDRFEDLGLVDDESFARRWVESRLSHRHRSRVVLRRELADRGVAREVADEALAQVSAEDELTAATAYVDKAARGLSALDPQVRRRRLADRLARRGFGPEIIRRALKDIEKGDDQGCTDVLDPAAGAT